MSTLLSLLAGASGVTAVFFAFKAKKQKDLVTPWVFVITAQVLMLIKLFL